MASATRMTIRAARRALPALLVLLCPSYLQAWGFAGHRIVNAKATAMLAPPLAPLFGGNAEYLAEHSIDPDLWRAAGVTGEDPNHFLDMDAFGAYPFPDLPRGESDHLARHGEEARAKGRVPWRVAEVYDELVSAFREGDEPRILERAAVLGHYVGDAHVPLHAVLNYDGQLTGQRGIHGRWESTLVERHQQQLEAGAWPKAASPPGEPSAATFEVLLESFRHAEAVLAADREVTRGKDLAETPLDDRYDDAYYSRLHAREAERVRARLGEAASMLAALWQQGWEEAGRPRLDAAFRVPYVRGRTRVVLATLDGGAEALLDDAVARGLMPHLARLRGRGATARGSLTTLPAKTASGHAALFTGAWSDRNGIAGNQVSLPDAPVTEVANGFSSTFLQAEPLWVTAARQGLKATVVSATQVFPFAPYLHERRFGGNYGRGLTLFDGYQNLEASDRVFTAAELPTRPAGVWLGPLPPHVGEVREFAIHDLGMTVDGLLYDDPADPADGFDTVYLALDRDPTNGVALKPLAPRTDADAFRTLTASLGGGQAGLHFRLFELSADGGRLLLYRAAPHVLRSSRPEVEGEAHSASGGFLGNGAERRYEDGDLGPPLWGGGDGTAEARLLETIALVTRQFARLTDFAWDRTDWHLLVTYLPYPDAAFHVWVGRLDRKLPGHDPELAARLQPWMDRVLRLVDGFVGHLAERAGDGVALAIGADHGMVGTSRVLKPNVALARAGLLSVGPDGAVDLGKTLAFYSRGQFVLLNRASRPGGVVSPEAEAAVTRRVREALRGLRDPEGGRPVVLEVRGPDGIPPAGGPHGGDLYLSVAPGYEVSAALRGEPLEDGVPAGDHALDPRRKAMHASFTVAGPGVPAGAELGLIRQTDVAPTLAALLGIEPPAQAVGHVLTGALAHRRPTSRRTSSPAASPPRR